MFREVLRNRKLSDVGDARRENGGGATPRGWRADTVRSVRERRGRAGGGRAGRGKRDSPPATGGKDLGKRKGVAIDYLTGDEADFGSWWGPDGSAAPTARLPN